MPITIQLPDLAAQTKFNLARWTDIIADPELAKLSYVAWLAPDRTENMAELVLFELAPEICVEVLSPSNSAAEIDEKRALYFDSGAREVWICNLDGSMSFFVGPGNLQSSASILCPAFPAAIP